MTVNIDYTSRDFDGLKYSLLHYARTAFPDWIPASEGDFGVLLVELLAYMGDINSYYVDRAQRESYIGTASQADSVLQIARMLGYEPHSGTPATGTITLSNSTASAITVPTGTKFASEFVPELDAQIIFEADTTSSVPAGSTLGVTVTEGETKKDDVTGNPLSIGEGSGAVSQSIRLVHSGVYSDTVVVYVAGEKWREVPHLIDADPDEKAYAVHTDSSGYTWVDFGDGLNGRIPAQGLPITATYRVGVGAAGNISADRITTVYKGDLPGISLVANANTMSGGADPETLEQVRANAPKSFASQQRAVTTTDFENFALAVPGVTKAKTVANFWSSVTTYILGPDALAPGAALVDRTTLALQEKALAGVTVTVGTPSFIPINLGSVSSNITVQAWPTYSNASVNYSVEQALRDLLSATNADLGMKLTVSMVYKAIMDIEGVRYVDIPLMVRADAAQSGTADIQLQAWEFPTLGDLYVTTSGGLG